jgi:hypothetical protein
MVLHEICQWLDKQTGKITVGECPFDAMRDHPTHSTLLLVCRVFVVISSVCLLFFVFHYHNGHPYSCEKHPFHCQLLPYFAILVFNVASLWFLLKK